MIKIFWYLVSVITILLIIINHPNNNNMNGLMNQISLSNFSGSQKILNKLIVVNVLLFFILTVLSVNIGLN